MCSCRRRSGWADGGWRCVSDVVVGAEPVWSDEFNNAAGSGRLDSSKWDHFIGPNYNNQEKQYYTDRAENYRVSGGVLKIIGKRERYGGMDYTSASIKTKGMGDWGPGHRIEVRAKVPMGVGTWPAIWMMPTDSAYGGWPDSGEIDIMEAVGRSPDKLFGTVHTGAYNHMKGTHQGSNYYTDPSEWHTYSIDWEDTQIKWYVDSYYFNKFAPDDTSNTAKWPFDQRFYLILNLAIGGTLGGSVRFGDEDQVMEIDYVRVYCLDGGQTCTTPRFSCCNGCKSYMPFCSPESQNCYTTKNKDYYESCPRPGLAETSSMRSNTSTKLE
jgi:beta-glucanase (GH16 family)